MSLQSHKYRDEHWVVVSGKGMAVLDNSFIALAPGISVVVPKGVKHRIINDSINDMLVLSETQIGVYLGEDDIIRYEDDFGRL